MPYRKGAPCPKSPRRSTATSETGSTSWSAITSAAIGDLWIALEEEEDFATAERLGIEFGEDFRLLADIGWQPKDDREAFELTMPTHDLMEALKRLHGEAEAVLSELGYRARVTRGTTPRPTPASSSASTPARKCSSTSTSERVSERDRNQERSACAPASWTASSSPTWPRTGTTGR